MTCPVAASTAAVIYRRRRCLLAEAITVSSNPTRAVGPTLSGSPAASSAASETAAQTVLQLTPKRRAAEATDPSTACARSAAQAPARSVSTRRGPAKDARSAQLPAPQPGFAHRQTRLSHRTVTARPSGTGTSLSTTSRRPLERARCPQQAHNTRWPPGVCTPTTTSPAPSSTPVTSKPGAPNHARALTSTTGASRLLDYT